MYAAVPDPYCYPNSAVLKNLRNLRTQKALDRFEAVMTAWRAKQPMPSGRLGVSHYKAVHRHLFQDVYQWAGKFRAVRISKGNSMFCYPDHIAGEMARLFSALQKDGHFRGLTPEAFAKKAAHFLAELNGNKLHDTELLKELAVKFPWVQEVYAQTSAFIHFSARHAWANVSQINEQERTFRLEISPEDPERPEHDYFEKVSCCVKAEITNYTAEDYTFQRPNTMVSRSVCRRPFRLEVVSAKTVVVRLY